MTDEEMRRLDAWIAEHAFGIEVGWNSGFPYNRKTKLPGSMISHILYYTKDPRFFATVKREIERRRWRWGGEYHPDQWYWFCIWKEQNTDDPLQMKVTVLGEGYERSEELAGCLAFKAAVEAADGEDTG